MAELTKAQIDEARALYEAGKVEAGRALLKKYREAPDAAPAPAPASPAPARRVASKPTTSAKTAAPRPPTAVAPSSVAPASNRLWGSVSAAIKEVPEDALPKPKSAELVVTARPILPPTPPIAEIEQAAPKARKELSLKYIQTGATKEDAEAAAAAGVARMRERQTDIEGKQLPVFVTDIVTGKALTPAKEAVRSLLPQKITSASTTSRDGVDLTKLNTERAKRSRELFDTYKSEVVKDLKPDYTAKELYDKMEVHIRGEMSVRAAELARNNFEDIVGRPAADEGEKKELEGLILDTLVSQVLPQRVDLNKRQPKFTTSGAVWNWLSTSRNDVGDVYESIPAAALRDIGTGFQWAYKPIQKALTYDVTSSGTPIDTEDPAYKIEQAMPDVIKASPLLGKTILPRPFQGREAKLAPRQGYLEEAASSVAAGQGLGDLFAELPAYQKMWTNAGYPWVPQAAGLGLELVNPYLTPLGPALDAGAGAVGLASKAGRGAGLGRTANALEGLADPAKALERLRSEAKATNIARGTDAFKDISPAYREALEISSARNVVADKMAKAVIPVAMLAEAVTHAEEMVARHAEAAVKWPAKAEGLKPDLTRFWLSYADSGLMDQPVVRAIINKTEGRLSPELELVELRKALNEWKREFDVSASPEAQQLYAIGRAADTGSFNAENPLTESLKQGKQYVAEELLNAVPGNIVFVTPTVVADAKKVEGVIDDLGLRMKELTKGVQFKDGKAIVNGKEMSLTDYARWFDEQKGIAAKEMLGDAAHELEFTGAAERAASVPKERRSVVQKMIDSVKDNRVANDVRKTPLKLANELTALRNELATIPDEVAKEIERIGFDRVVYQVGINSDAWERAIKLYFGGNTYIPDEVLEAVIKEKGGGALNIDGFNAVTEEILRRRPDLEAQVPRKVELQSKLHLPGSRKPILEGAPYSFAALATLATEYAAEKRIVDSYDRLAKAAPEFTLPAGDPEVAKLVKAMVGAKLAAKDLNALADSSVALGRKVDFNDIDLILEASDYAEFMLLKWGAHNGVSLDALGAIPSVEKLDDKSFLFGLDTAAEVERFRQGAETGALARNLEALRLSNDPVSWAYVGEVLGDMNRVMVGGMLGGNYLPNMRFHGTNFATAPLIIATTVGLPSALGSTARMYDWQLMKWAKGADDVMFVARDGKQWTKKALQDAIDNSNIAFSQATFEFGPQVIEDMRTIAKVGPDGKPSKWMASTVDTLTPNLLKSSFWKKLGEQSDVLWRQNVFVTALKEGKTQEEAAKLARESMLDYRSLSTIERDKIARYFMFYAFQRQMTKETLLALTGRNPKDLQRIIQTQRAMSKQAEEDLGLTRDDTLGRAWMLDGKTYDGVKKTVLAGPDAPPISALRDVFQLAAWAGRAADPTIRDSALQDGADAIVDRGMTPGAQLLMELRKYQPENKDTGRIDPHMVAALQTAGLWPWAVTTFDIKPIATEARRGGEPTFRGTAEYSGEQYRFDTQSGYGKWLVLNYIMTQSGVKRNIDDYTKTLIQAGLAPEGAEMKRYKDGKWYLYALGMQTPIGLPTKLQAEVDAEEQVLRELLEMSKK